MENHIFTEKLIPTLISLGGENGNDIVKNNGIN